MLKLYNTLSKAIEQISKKDHINLYTCGPTAYNYAHIGNLRSYIMADLLYRTLKFDGYNPKWVMNITDIDDKTIKGAVAKYGSGANTEHLREYTKFYLDEFIKDLGEVSVLKDEIQFIRVTDVIPQIQEFILELIDKGYAYKAEDGSTYFSIEKYQNDFGDYGALVGEKFIEGKKIGARVKVDEYDKDNLSDFALWKAWDEADARIFWDHPVLGKGRPGWHIECSVINKTGFNGEITDIHTGGVDLIFPHHTNEIAQSQPVHRPFVNYWHHNEHLLVDGGRMGKRFNNFYTIKDLKEKGFSGQDLRYFFMGSGFGSQQNFTFDGLAAAHSSRERLLALPQGDGSSEEFANAINNNLNFSEALAVIWSKGTLSEQERQVLGLSKQYVLHAETASYSLIGYGAEPNKLPKEISELLEKRKLAKDQKNYSQSDELRKQIEDLGYELMDTAEGQKVKKRINI